MYICEIFFSEPSETNLHSLSPFLPKYWVSWKWCRRPVRSLDLVHSFCTASGIVFPCCVSLVTFDLDYFHGPSVSCVMLTLLEQIIPHLGFEWCSSWLDAGFAFQAGLLNQQHALLKTRLWRPRRAAHPTLAKRLFNRHFYWGGRCVQESVQVNGSISWKERIFLSALLCHF